MREIKFRAWDKSKGEYIYDYQETYDFENYGFYSPEYLDYEQYTGLKDKNGVEIYEGDVLQFPYSKHMVIWSVSGFMVKRNNDNELYSMSVEGCTYCTIIGNIHEK